MSDSPRREPRVPLSILDLAPVADGSDAARALHNARDLAQHAEEWGYHRYWLAEHHGIAGVASAATSIVIAHVAAGTSRIRVGAGGIMLPNHSPLVIAEQFGTLASLYPGRIDLGLGRAPGSDPATARALRRHPLAGESFPEDVMELMAYFEESTPGQRVLAVPGAGLDVPIWILGSSLFGASLAAALGLPFAFASHFAPASLVDALATYRTQFRPSASLDRPYAMIGVNVFAADTDDEAALLFTSLQQAFVSLRRGMPRLLPPPLAGFADTLHAGDRELLDEMLQYSVTGAHERVANGLQDIVDRTGADELMLTGQIFDHAARLRSFEIVSGIELRRASAPPRRDAVAGGVDDVGAIRPVSSAQ